MKFCFLNCQTVSMCLFVVCLVHVFCIFVDFFHDCTVSMTPKCSAVQCSKGKKAVTCVMRKTCVLDTPALAMTSESNGNLLQYSCLENPMDGGAW